jgi:hypothetical protein
MALAALLLGTAVIAAVVIGTPPRSRRGAAAAASFLAAWQRKLSATYVVDATVTRTVADGGQLVAPLRMVQRPPDRLTYGYGDATGRTKDATLRCPSTPSGASACFTSPGAPSYDDDVAQELATLHSYFDGDKPLYRVVDFRDGCFRLDLALQFPAPPWGTQALFCFDRATGAPSLTVIDYGTVTERTVAAAIRSTVTDADLQVPQDRGKLVAEPGVNPSATTTTAPPASSSTPPTEPPTSS